MPECFSRYDILLTRIIPLQRIQFGIALTPLGQPEFVTCVLTFASDNIINSLFKKEKLQTINTPRASFIRQLQTTYLNENGRLSSDFLEWDRNRDTDFLCLSKGVYFMENISGNPQGVTMLQLEKWLNLRDFFRSDLRAKILDSYRIFAELVRNPKLNKVFKKPAKISSVEFTTIALLVFAHKDTMTMAQLSAAIAKMREDGRDTYEIGKDSKSQVAMIDFIKSLKMAKIPAITGGLPSVAGSTAGLKRKRAEQQSDGEEERKGKDDNRKRGKHDDQKSNAKKSSTTTTSNAKPSGSRPIAEVLLFKKQQHPSALSAFLRALPKAPNSLTGLGPPNPQLHSSPG